MIIMVKVVAGLLKEKLQAKPFVPIRNIFKRNYKLVSHNSCSKYNLIIFGHPPDTFWLV